MKPLLLTILILIPLTAFAQEFHYSGGGKVTIPLGKEKPETATQVNPQYERASRRMQ